MLKRSTVPHRKIANTKGRRETVAPKEPKLTKIRKRDGRIVDFDPERIEIVVAKAMRATGGDTERTPAIVAKAVVSDLIGLVRKNRAHIPTVEDVQDLVERQLILHKHAEAAKAYILYRDKHAELRRLRGAVPEHVKRLADESKKYFRNQLAEFVYYSTYSKWIPEENRRETWIETINRYIDFMRENLGKKLNENEYAEVREYMLTMNALGSMRLLWSAGTAARKSNVCAYNCSFIAPSKWQDFGEIMFILMCGTGVGFSVEHQNIGALPMIERQRGEKPLKYVIGDNKEGWADGFIFGLNTWSAGRDVEFDYSQIRPRGARLKTMGGRASGPEPLRALIDFTRAKMLQRQGRRLSPLDAHDIICKIGEIVVAGGVRRSALISISDLDDHEMRDAKNGQFYLTNPQRSMANNSAVYNTKPILPEFLDEWVNLVKSGSGERGIFNRGSLKKQLPARRWRIFERDFWKSGTNPCVPAETWIMTTEGARQVYELVGTPFTALVNGTPHNSAGFFETGVKEVFEISTTRGFTFRATANHRVLVVDYKSRKLQKNVWKEVRNLRAEDRIVLHRHSNAVWDGRGTEGEGWLLGNLFGDGNIEKNGKANLDYWGQTQSMMMTYARDLVHSTVGARSDCVGHVAKTGYGRVQSSELGRLSASYGMSYGYKTPTSDMERASSKFYEGFLRGWFDADGSVQGTQQKGVSVRLASSNLEALTMAQRMLARLGIMGTLYRERRIAQWRMLPDGKGNVASYFCKADHELIISGENIISFYDRVNFTDPLKKTKLKKLINAYRRNLNKEYFYSAVKDVRAAGNMPVYDCGVQDIHAFDANGAYLHNCGEIVLKSKQFCNLSEVVARSEDTEDTLLEKVRIATILGTYQASLTNFSYLSKDWKKNCQEEALLGVSITGQWDCKAVRNPNTLRKMKEVAIETNRKYASRFGIRPSTCITCVKPSGNTSQLTDAASGMHPRHARYYIRRVRIESHNPLFQMVKELGVPHHPEVGKDHQTATTFVLEFPIKAPDGAIFKDDITSLDQLKHWKMVKENYTEHNPSTTISIGAGEWLNVANWVYENWDIVGGLSFLPRADHVYQLAPYEAISEERYGEMAKNFPEIDFSKVVLHEYEDTTEGAKELACVAGSCEIDIPPAQVVEDATIMAEHI